MLKSEMEEIGLSNVRKDEITVDSWDFQKAELEFEDGDGIIRKFQLGAYQTQFVTDGKEEISIKALQGFYFPDGLDNTL